MIVIDRFDPRLDRDELKEIYQDFIKNKSYFPSNWKQFETELNKRVLDLQYRNSMVVAKEEGKIVGWKLNAEEGGQFLITVGFRYVTAVEGSIISSMRIFLAALLGPLVAGEAPLTETGWLGAMLLFAANAVLAMRRSRMPSGEDP